MKVEDRVTDLVKQCNYVSINQVREYLKEDAVSFSDGTIKEYLYRLQREGVVYDAGRGWYSTIEKEYGLNTDPIDDLIADMNQRFPLLEFCVWSTRQIASHYHHLPTKFHYFIHTEKNTEDAVYDYLIGNDKNAYQNPVETDKKHFETTKQTYVVRPKISRQPCEKHTATIEAILVTLFKEKEALTFLADREYTRIFDNIVNHWRIKVSKLVSYASRRGIKPKLLGMISDFPPGKSTRSSI